MSEAWSQWQGQLIDGRFLLEQYLGGAGPCAVFRTQLPTADAYSSDPLWRGANRPLAIKLIADSPNAELQLSRWRMAQGISHPHLLRILDTGRCRLGDIDLIFAVMEHAEENLAQIVPERPLTVAEAREMLLPVLDALAYLHRRGLVHGHLRPANIMAAGNVVKLSSDGISPADEAGSAPSRFAPRNAVAHAWEPAQANAIASTGSGMARAAALGICVTDVAESHRQPVVGQSVSVRTSPDVQQAAQPSVYAAPETALGACSPAADVWSLGMTLAEVLTQHLPSPAGYEVDSEAEAEGARDRHWDRRPIEEADPLLPTDLPAQFVEIVRGCLRRDLQLRWTIPLIAARLQQGSPQGPSLPAAKESQEARVSAPASTLTSNNVSMDRDKDRDKASAGGSGVAQDSAALTPLAATLEKAIFSLRKFWRGTASVVPKNARKSLRALSAGLRALQRHASSLAWKMGTLPPLLRHFALPGIIAIAAFVAIYTGMSLRRSPEPGQGKPAPAVVIKPQIQQVNSKRPSPVSRRAKPNPPAEQQVEQTRSAQPSPEPPAPAGEPSVEAAAVASAKPSVRRIDDSVPDTTNSNTAGGNPDGVDVAQRVLPHASPSALATIHGTVRVSVRVNVDPSGNVVRTEFASPGPSRYFAQLSLEAAQNWKFAPGHSPGSPVLLHFEFTRSGAQAFATRAGS
jgi:serine/threonine protein kinase